MVENAAAMAARTDTSKKVTGVQKRDIDYINEYVGLVKQYDEARKAAEKAGTAFDDSAVMNKIKASLGISE